MHVDLGFARPFCRRSLIVRHRPRSSAGASAPRKAALLAAHRSPPACPARLPARLPARRSPANHDWVLRLRRQHGEDSTVCRQPLPAGSRDPTQRRHRGPARQQHCRRAEHCSACGRGFPAGLLQVASGLSGTHMMPNMTRPKQILFALPNESGPLKTCLSRRRAAYLFCPRIPPTLFFPLPSFLLPRPQRPPPPPRDVRGRRDTPATRGRPAGRVLPLLWQRGPGPAHR